MVPAIARGIGISMTLLTVLLHVLSGDPAQRRRTIGVREAGVIA